MFDKKIRNPLTAILLKLLKNAVFMPVWMALLADKKKVAIPEFFIVISIEYRYSREGSLSLAECFGKPVERRNYVTYVIIYSKL